MNLMRKIRIEKITLNIGVGQAGEKLEKAVTLLQSISNAKPVKTVTLERIPTWGIRPNLPIGCKVTLRGKRAEELLRRLFQAVDNKIKINNFDNEGNLAFGIKEYIDIPNVEYNASIGIIGLEIAVTLMRAGYRVKRRKVKRVKIPTRHRVTKEESIEFFKDNFNIKLVEEESQ